MTEHDDTAPAPAPVLRVVTPGATPEQVAALVAVVSALGASGEAPRPPRRVWNAPARLIRPSYAAGPGGWRASGLPR